ncbi:MAG: hypothetical protein CL573_07160 [Alphaproteobacteria bacterium]|nr:hypothetical protein [Alphaproteobacteria bacterium]HCP00575.1 hypothetical protein [Rhodospirillaceae bacterium]
MQIAANSTADGEDRFDPTVGLFGILNVIFGHRPPGDAQDRVLRDVEGCILGLDPARLHPRTG